MAPDPGDGAAVQPKTMRLRFAGTCCLCGLGLAAGTTAVYDRVAKTVHCVDCPSQTRAGNVDATTTGPAPVESVAGSSGRREYERRVAAREERIRTAHPKLGGLILAVTDEPQSTKAWAVGARGEEALGRRLDGLAGQGVRTLHDRRIPRTKANIDHIAVAPSGVFVIDAKKYKGRPQLRVEGGFLRPRVEKLMVGTRDRTTLVAGVHKQVALVREVLDGAGLADVPVSGALCFVEADWPLIGGSFVIDGVHVLWPRKLTARVSEPGVLAPDRVEMIHPVVAEAFPAA